MCTVVGQVTGGIGRSAQIVSSLVSQAESPAPGWCTRLGREGGSDTIVAQAPDTKSPRGTRKEGDAEGRRRTREGG